MPNDKVSFTPEIQRSLLQAMRSNQLDLAPFVSLFKVDDQQATHDLSRLSDQENSRLTELAVKTRSKAGIMPITNRSLKARLLQAVCQQRFQPEDFPEIREACKLLQPDLSVFSEEEIDFLVEMVLKSGL